MSPDATHTGSGSDKEAPEDQILYEAKIARAAKGDEDSRVPAGAVLTEANPCVIVTGDQVSRICLFNIAICLLVLVKQISEDTSIKKKAEKKYLDVLD